MPCVLRASGRKFDVDSFIAKTSLPVCAVYRRGEPKLPGTTSEKRNNTSGINVDVSDADFDNLSIQIRDAIKFLRKHRRELGRLRKQTGLEAMTLDFGVAQRRVAAQFDYFPPNLLLAAGEMGIGLEICWYHAFSGG